VYDLVVIGSPSFDRVVHSQGPENERRLSGPVMYTARSAAQLGIENMALIGSLSRQYLDRFANCLNELGIPEYYSIDSPDTGGFEVEYNGGNDPSYLSVLGVPKSIGIRDIPDEFLSARVIVLSPLLQEIGAEFVEWLCNSSNASILLDPQLRDVGIDKKLKVVSELQIIEKTRCFLDFIKPNEQEAYLITGERDVFLAAELLVDMLAENCIITLAEKGSLIYDGNLYTLVPSYPSHPTDTQGAGAAFLAGFVNSRLEGRSMTDAAAFATAVASQKIEYPGLEFHLTKSQAEERAIHISNSITTR
jgi:sugar/nucleoside kinase (ribokinase family)